MHRRQPLRGPCPQPRQHGRPRRAVALDVEQRLDRHEPAGVAGRRGGQPARRPSRDRPCARGRSPASSRPRRSPAPGDTPRARARPRRPGDYRPVARAFPRRCGTHRREWLIRSGFAVGGAGTADALPFGDMPVARGQPFGSRADAPGSSVRGRAQSRRWPWLARPQRRRLNSSRPSSAGAAHCSAAAFWHPFSTSR